MDFGSIVKNKIVKNAGWLMAGKIVQMILSMVVGLLVARYLGPSLYGLLNYAQAYTAFFAAVCNLGITSILVKELIDRPDEQGKTIGSTLFLRVVASLFSAIAIVLIVNIIDMGDLEAIAVVSLCSLSLVFQVGETFNYWFQSRLRSKATAIATLLAYAGTTLYRVVLLLLHADIVWFAVASALDYAILSILLLVLYKKEKGQKLSIDVSRQKELLSKSYHFILPSLMVAVYGYCDKIMLRQMMDDGQVGCYSAALVICTIWCFVLASIVDSVNPSIMEAHKDGDQKTFEKRNIQLYAIMIYVSFGVSAVFTLFAGPIVAVLYGDAYKGAVAPLRILTWYTAFSYLGVARNAWIVCEEKQKFLKWIYGGSAAINVLLNFALIPLFGPSGAAIASLVTQISTVIIVPLSIPELRPNVRLILRAFALKGIR